MIEFNKSVRMLRDANSKFLVDLAKNNDRIVVLDSDLMNSSGLLYFKQFFPDRTLNCGVQEANMVGVAGGLSAVGYIPIVHSFASFAIRKTVDQIFLAGVYNKQNIKIIGTDPGIINSANGGTHMSFEDMGIMRSLPSVTIVDPADEVQLKSILPTLIESSGVCYIRLFRKTTTKIYAEGTKFIVGKSHLAKNGNDLTIIAEGALLIPEALKAAAMLEKEGISVRVVDMFTIKPLDTEAIIKASEETKAILTVENHSRYGGLGSAVAEVLAENGISIPFARIAYPEKYGETATIQYILEKNGMDCQGIYKQSLDLLNRSNQY